MIVHLAATRLHDVHVFTAHRFADLHAANELRHVNLLLALGLFGASCEPGLSVAELARVHGARLDLQPVAHALHQVLVRVTAKHFDVPRHRRCYDSYLACFGAVPIRSDTK